MKNGFKKLASSAALASALFTLSGLAMAADTIKIGVSGPFTGGSSSMGAVSYTHLTLPTNREV